MITTNWDEVKAAHPSTGDTDEAVAVRHQLLMRYSDIVRQYIFGAVKDKHIAEDLTQEFSLRFVRGQYGNVDQSRGRYRDYLLASLRNLATDWMRKQSEIALTASVADCVADENEGSQLESLEESFERHWREEVLSHAWANLKKFDDERGNHYYLVLHYKAANPTIRSQEMASRLSSIIGEPVTSDWVRQKLHRSRQKFAEFLIAEIRHSLAHQDEDLIEEELATLGLKKYVLK